MSAPVYLTAEWRALVVLNYAVDAAVLAPYLPRGVELDLWEGEAVLSLVGFLFIDTRLLGVRIPFHRNFEEVNLRFYVRRRAGDEWRRGVTFIREIVPRRAVAWTAWASYNEQYRALPMRHTLSENVTARSRTYEYAWKFKGYWHSLGAEVQGDAQPFAAGSREEFIFQRYWGYTPQRDGGTIEYEVEHSRWNVWEATSFSRQGDLAALSGPSLATAMNAAPLSTLVTDGSPIVVRRPTRIA